MGTISDEAVLAAASEYVSAKASGVDAESVRADLRAREILAGQGMRAETCSMDEYLAAAEQAERELASAEPVAAEPPPLLPGEWDDDAAVLAKADEIAKARGVDVDELDGNGLAALYGEAIEAIHGGGGSVVRASEQDYVVHATEWAYLPASVRARAAAQLGVAA